MPTKLPILRTMAEAYRLLLRHSRVLLLWSAPWLLLAILLNVAHFRLDVALSPLSAASAASALVYIVTQQLIRLACFATVAVAWHRLVLLPAEASPATYRRHEVWIYFAIAFAIDCGLMAPFALSYVWTANRWGGSSGTAQYTQIAVLATLVLTLGYVVLRMFLVLPARAVGHRSALSVAWNAMRGNVLRFLFASVLGLFPVVLLTELIGGFYNDWINGSPLSVMRYSPDLRNAGDVSAWWLNATILMSILTVAYRQVVGPVLTPTNHLVVRTPDRIGGTT
jgi:hypothetical protein